MYIYIYTSIYLSGSFWHLPQIEEIQWSSPHPVERGKTVSKVAGVGIPYLRSSHTPFRAPAHRSVCRCQASSRELADQSEQATTRRLTWRGAGKRTCPIISDFWRFVFLLFGCSSCYWSEKTNANSGFIGPSPYWRSRRSSMLAERPAPRMLNVSIYKNPSETL